MNTPDTHEAIYGVYRLGHEPCWVVSLKRVGRTVVRRFADAHHGGTEAARQAAVACRDQMLREHPALSRRERRLRPRSTNTSGIPGVYRVVKRSGYACWIAKTQLNTGKQISRTFSVNLLGEQTAREKAIEARMAQLEQIKGFCLLNDEAKALSAQLNAEKTEHFDAHGDGHRG